MVILNNVEEGIPNMKKRVLALCLAITFLTVTMSGCVKVVKIGEEGKLTGAKTFSAGDDVDSFWESQALPELTEKAVDLGELLTQANGDLESVAEEYGTYSMGASGELSYTVKGTASVTAVETEKKAGYIEVNLEGYEGTEVIKIQVGSVMKGSSVRDSLSFIKFGDYTNQQEYAAVSQGINSKIMETVIDPEAAGDLLGKTISFTGCFTVKGNDELIITPIALEEE